MLPSLKSKRRKPAQRRRPQNSPEAERPESPSEDETERALGYNDLIGKEVGFTALHLLRETVTHAAERLLKYGSDLDQPTAGDGTTPMLLATINGNFDLALLLLNKELIRTRQRRTVPQPVHCA